MKKTLSILLALVLVLTSCFVASAETTETVTDLIGAYGSYDVQTYGWAFSALRTPVQEGDTAQDDNSYTAAELANTLAYNKTGAGYGQWLGIDANTLEFSYDSSNFIINQQSYGQSTYGVAFDENLKIVRAVRGFEVGKYYKVSFDLAHRFDTTTIAVPGFEAGVVGQADLLNDITLNGGSFDMTNELTTHSFTFLADSAIVDQDGYAYLMFRSPVTYDAFINNISITEYQPPVKPEGWLVNNSSSQNISGYEGSVEYTLGDGIVIDEKSFPERGETLKLDTNGLRVSLPLAVAPNTNYTLSFSYYADALETVGAGNNANLVGKTFAISNTGIFIPNHPAFEGVTGNRLGLAYTMSYLNLYAYNYHMNTPAGQLWTVDSTGAKTGFADQDGDGVADGDKRTYTPVENFHGIEAGKWYTLSFEFNSREFEDLTFTLSKIGGANMWLDNITLTVDYNKYFEDSNNWALSLVGSETNRLNISTDGSDGTYFMGEKGSTYHTTNTDVAYTENGEGTSIKLSYPTHASNIALPEITAGKTYRVKFSYKVVTNANTDMSASQLSGMGIYSPAFMDKAISEGNTDVNFSRGTIGWNVFDRYNGTNGIYRYRDETLLSCSQNANGYVSVTGDYTYNAANTWYTKEFYFTANDYTDLYLVVLPGNSSSVIYLDNFEFEKIEIDNTFAVDGSDTPISMRKATDGGVKQAIRYKFTVENSKKEGVSGYELLEYGAVAASDKWLTEGELPEYDVLTGAGKQTALNKKAVVGVSYKPAEDINVMFDYNNSYTVFTAALYNIGFNGKTTDYYEWGTDYIVRPYAVYYNRDNAHTVVVYGDEASSSVFAVMNAILTSNDTSDVAVTDESYVSDMLDSNPEILEEFINAGYEYGNAEVQTVKKK